MPGGRVLEQSLLVTSEGPDALARALTRQSEHEQVYPVLGAGGEELARLEPTYTDSGRDKLVRGVIALALQTDGVRNDRSFRLVEASGNNIALEMRLAATVLSVFDPSGEQLGTVQNVSRPGRVDIEFHEGEPRKRLGVVTGWGRQVASMSAPNERPPHDFQVLRADGSLAARVVNEGGRLNTLEIAPGADPVLRALCVAFSCSLLQRRWIMAPTVSGGGG